MSQGITHPFNLSKNSGLGVILGIIVFIRTMPCFLWSVEDIIRPICAVIVLIICLLNISKERWTFWILLCLSSAYIWAVVFVDHSGIITLFNFLAFAFIPVIRKELVYDSYKVFWSLMVIFIACSIINYLFVSLGLTLGGKIIEPLNTLKTHKYIMYPFLVIPQGETSARFHGIWDEPGMIGTMCGLILIAERMNLKKKGNWMIMAGGLLSLSFYFYVALMVGFILFSQRLKNRFAIIMLFLALLVVSYNIPIIYDTIWSRFEFDTTEGKFVGDNRNGGGLSEHYELIAGTAAFYTGEGSVEAAEYSGGASLLLIIIKHGFIFVALSLLGYAILSWREIKSKKEWVLFFLFFLATLYQRPGFYNTSSIFLYTMLIYEFGTGDVAYKENRKGIKKIKAIRRTI